MRANRTVEAVRFLALVVTCVGLLLFAAERMRPEPVPLHPLPEAAGAATGVIKGAATDAALDKAKGHAPNEAPNGAAGDGGGPLAAARAQIDRLSRERARLQRDKERLEAELQKAREAPAPRPVPTPPAPVPPAPEKTVQVPMLPPLLVPPLDRDLVPPPIETFSTDEGEGPPPAGGGAASPPPPPRIVRPATVEAGIAAYERRDYATARAIWEELARRNIPRAQYHLGALLYEGLAGPPDPVQAYVWLTRAVRGGIDQSEPLRVRLRAEMTPAQRAEAEARLAGR